MLLIKTTPRLRELQNCIPSIITQSRSVPSLQCSNPACPFRIKIGLDWLCFARKKDFIPPPNEDGSGDRRKIRRRGVESIRKIRKANKEKVKEKRRMRLTMLKIIQGMQKMQEQILTHKGRSGRDKAKSNEDEALRGGVDLHHLPEWSPDTAPVDLQDWLL